MMIKSGCDIIDRSVYLFELDSVQKLREEIKILNEIDNISQDNKNFIIRYIEMIIELSNHINVYNEAKDDGVSTLILNKVISLDFKNCEFNHETLVYIDSSELY